MVYFKPIGGLANRMRAIDSAISWCEDYKLNLTICWLKNFELASSFDELFNAFYSDTIEINIVDCPSDFPQKDIFNSKNLLATKENFFSRKVKNILNARILNQFQKDIIKNISDLNDSSILTNHDDFDPIFTRVNKNEWKSYSELDSVFIKEVRVMMIDFFKNPKKHYFISSCYRFHELDQGYSRFRLKENLHNKITEITSSFKNVIGLHIRRTDHLISKTHSGNEKFYTIIEEKIEENSSIRFFLCTDDPKTKSEMISKFGAKILFNEIQSYNRSSNEAIKDAILDLYCLSKTNMIYGSHQSSFSQIASEITDIPLVTVK